MARSKKTYHLLNDYHLLAYECVDSTNEEAKRLAEGGASHGAVIWAKEQTAGRGRLGRQWVSKPGNLYVSFLLAPDCALAHAAQLSFVAAVAAVEALQPILPPSSQKSGTVFCCKWPNDILLGDKKLGGILLESFTTINDEGKSKQWVVAGLGLNIDSHPGDALYPATSLKEAGVELISAKIVLTRLVERFIANYDAWVKDGFAPVRESWLKHAYGIGKPVEISAGAEVLCGTFEGMTDGGEMCIRTDAGQEVTINSGDVFFNPLKAVTTKK